MRRAEEQTQQDNLSWCQRYPDQDGYWRFGFKVHGLGRMHRTEKSWQGWSSTYRQADWCNCSFNHGYSRRRGNLWLILLRRVWRGLWVSCWRQRLRVLQGMQKVNCLHYCPTRCQWIHAWWGREVILCQFRSLHDSICVAKRTLESGKVVAGGGAVDVANSIHL